MSRTTPEPNLPVAEASADQIENGCRGMYGPTWDGPPEKMPGEKMKEVWRTYSKNCLNAALATPIPDTSAGEREIPPLTDDETRDVRWAVNYLLEQIAARFEAWDTMDLWRSDAASTVRRFKHDLSAPKPSSAGEWMREALELARLDFHNGLDKLDRALDLQGPSGKTGDGGAA